MKFIDVKNNPKLIQFIKEYNELCKKHGVSIGKEYDVLILENYFEDNIKMVFDGYDETKEVLQMPDVRSFSPTIKRMVEKSMEQDAWRRVDLSFLEYTTTTNQEGDSKNESSSNSTPGE